MQHTAHKQNIICNNQPLKFELAITKLCIQKLVVRITADWNYQFCNITAGWISTYSYCVLLFQSIVYYQFIRSYKTVWYIYLLCFVHWLYNPIPSWKTFPAAYPSTNTTSRHNFGLKPYRTLKLYFPMAYLPLNTTRLLSDNPALSDSPE